MRAEARTEKTEGPSQAHSVKGGELGKVAGGLGNVVGIVSCDNQDCTYSRQCQDTW